ncbi:MAG TPA: trypsin-like peptidase domain-containing protein, partial [Streptosporangiaceae bacterium]|nr:trypsin-like peptidase domain-containing protein [Streptosporangiaceae bacterium]
MQEGHGSEHHEPEQPGGWSPLPDGGSTPGDSGAGGSTPPDSGQPGSGQPGSGLPVPAAYPGQGTWPMPSETQWAPPPAAGSGQWGQPPGGSQGGWAPPPGGGYGQPGGGYGQPGGGYGPPGGGYGQPGGPQMPRPPQRGNRPLIYILVAVLAAALGASAVLAFQGGPSSNSLPPQNIPSPASSQGGNTNTSSINAQAVAAKVEPGVVDITSSLHYTGQVFEGTGMVLTPSGLVLTNNHVVNGSTRLSVTLAATGRRYAAQIVGTDAAADVALLKLVGASGLRTVQVGNSARVTLGTPVVAMGNAGGTGGAPTVTSGSITALHRTITASDSGSGTSEVLHNMLQTNAPIAEGDSGGPLSNAAAQVIGMDTAANTQALGGPGTSQGFAIPINRALAIAHQMLAGKGGPSIRLGQPAFLGVAVASRAGSAASGADSPQQQLRQLNQTALQYGGGINSSGSCLVNDAGNPVPAHIAPAASGTLIAGVFCNAPAHAAGLRAGDVILAVNGQTVTAPQTLTRVLTQFHPGERVSVRWMDIAGQRHTTPLTLAAGPAK